MATTSSGLSAAAVVLSVLVWAAIAYSAGPDLLPFIQSCPGGEGGPKNPMTGIALVDTFLCIIVPFFERLYGTSDSAMVAANVFPTFSVFSFFLNAEAGREGARGLITFPTLVIVLAQVLGFGVAAPLLLLLVLSPSPQRESPRGISQAHAWLCLAITLPFVGVSSLLAAVGPNREISTWLMAVLQLVTVAPLLLMLARLPVIPASWRKPSPEGSRVAGLAFGILGGISFVAYWSSILLFLERNYLIPMDPTSDGIEGILFSLLQLKVSLTPCAWALLADFAGVYLAVGLRALSLDGLEGLSNFIVTSAVLSPGMACALQFSDLLAETDS